MKKNLAARRMELFVVIEALEHAIEKAVMSRTVGIFKREIEERKEELRKVESQLEGW